MLRTPKGHPLVKSYGGCNRRGNSLRAKTIGILLISLFIALLQSTGIGMISLFIVTDNLELINRSNEHLNYTHPYPHNALKSEYHITEQIYLTHLLYKVTAFFTMYTDIKIVKQVEN